MSAPSLFSQLKVYNGTFSGESLWKIFIRPFVLILSPVVRVAHKFGSVLCTFSFGDIP